jgi:hypothetical protein
MTDDRRIALDRNLVGGGAVLCLVSAAGLWFLEPELWGKREMILAGCLRIGLVLVALWIGLPTRSREAAWARVTPWTFLGIVVLFAAAVLRPKQVLPVLFVLAAIGYFLRPRGRFRPGGRPPGT